MDCSSGTKYCRGKSESSADVRVRYGLHMFHMISTAMGKAAFL